MMPINLGFEAKMTKEAIIGLFGDKLTTGAKTFAQQRALS